MIIPVYRSLIANNPGQGKDSPELNIVFDGKSIRVRAHLNVAAALLESGVTHFRVSPVSGAPRAPFCMMGVCFDCLVIIDGVVNQQACMTTVREGMCIERQLSTAAESAGNQSESPT
ncbi:MAG: putative molibdopterin-dependent oxidoreductase YjgC [Gammaproteobacteria bacterium]|jgi:predicted molibdopterin-dependent oxidoreductase YjgC